MNDHHGKIWWVEHNSHDPKAAADHFAATAGWTIEHTPMPDSDYYVASREGVPVAGFMNLADIPGNSDIPPHWFTYIAVKDVDAATQSNETAGGQTIRPPFFVPEIGKFSIVSDPTGAVVGLVTPA